MTTLATLWPQYRSARPEVIDWRRNETAWLGFPTLHPLTRRTLTDDRVAAAIKARLRDASPSTVRRDLAALAAFWKWCVRKHELDAMPQYDAPPESAPRHRWLTETEIGKIWWALDDVPKEIAGPIRLAFLTGQRIGACISLKWEQVDGPVIDFNRGMTRRNKRRAALPITPNVQAVLDSVTKHGPHVFHKRGSFSHVTYGTVANWWEQALEKAGIEQCSLHTIRHSVATQLVAAGVPILEVSKMLGHSSVVITEKVYAKFSPEFASAAMAQMGRLVGR